MITQFSLRGPMDRTFVDLSTFDASLRNAHGTRVQKTGVSLRLPEWRPRWDTVGRCVRQ